MTKTKKTSAELVTTAECARILTDQGDKISAQALRKYAKKHGLVSQQVGRYLMVDPARIAARRQDFTREKMRGEHANSNQPKAPTAEIESLDALRDAKARNEEAKASLTELALYKETRDLISVAEFEVLLGLLMTLLKETLFGVNLSDDADAIMVTNNLPDDRKKPTQAILKKRRRQLATDFADLAKAELARLDPAHADGLPARLTKIVKNVQTMRRAELKAQTARKVPA